MLTVAGVVLPLAPPRPTVVFVASSAASKLPLQPPLEVGVGRVEVVLDVGACLIVVFAVP